MKVIPTEEFMRILKTLNVKYTTANYISDLIEEFGDEAYKDYGVSPFEITVVNKKRKDMLGGTISKVGDII